MRLSGFPKISSLAIVILAALCAGISPATAQNQPKAGAKAKSRTQACRNDDTGLKLPPGFCATVFADDIGHARQLVVAPSGVVYVNTWSGGYYGNQPPQPGGFLVALQDKSGSGKSDVVERFGETVETGGAGGTGIDFYKNAIYAELNDKILRYSLPEGSIVPTAPSDVIISGLPLGGDHPMHPFIIDANGSMFVDVATATNACQLKNRTLHSPGADPCTELETRGGIWRYEANKTDQKFSPAERYATGIRNGEGFAITSNGSLFVTQHGRDQLHSNWPELYKPEEEATLPAEEVLLLKSGGDYGWPECYYDPRQKKLVLAPEYGGDGGKKVGVCATKTPPVAAFPAHWGPNAMVHYDQKSFPARYRNGVFIAFHGSWNRAPYPQGGYNVVFQPLAGNHASGNCEIFADGFAGAIKSPDRAAYRPTGLAVGPDGSLYVSDDQHGRIYRIVYQGGAENASAKGTPCPSASAPAGEMVSASAKPPEGTHADAGAAAKNYPIPEGATRKMVALGDRLFHGRGSCTGCHGENGGGSSLGPDLTDQKWLWSDGSYAGITKTITDGVIKPKQYRSPMPPLKGQFTAPQISALAAYVWGLSHQKAAAATASTMHPAELMVPGEKIYPESLTTAADGRVIIGSIGARTIYAVKPGSSTAEPWIQPDDQPALGILGVFADNKANTLWACFSSAGPPNSPKAPSVLKAFDLQTGALKEKYQLPGGDAFCNDIAVGSDGTAYVSDTNNMQIDRLPKGNHQLEVWAGDGGFGAKGGVLDGISVLGDRVIVNTLDTSKLFSVPIKGDGSAGAITEIKLDHPIDRPDGMRAFGKDSVLIVEGGPTAKLSRITINGDSGQVTNLKEGCPDGPVSVTVVGTTGYVLGGQLGQLFNPNADQTAKPFRAIAVEVGKP
jgi:glucose/arabinose dehydrogenase/mono/diheme cytochrome c family protein